MLKLKEDILDYSQSDAFIFIEGETGSGKTLVAHALHAVSQKMSKTVITVHCGAYDENTLSDDYLGQYKKTIGFYLLFRKQKGGTLILEDIETLTIELQGKLLDKLVELEQSFEIRLITISNHSSSTYAKKILRTFIFQLAP